MPRAKKATRKTTTRKTNTTKDNKFLTNVVKGAKKIFSPKY